MRYLSVCSGIEAASVAWHPLGWKPVAFSEIEKFPSTVLAHHYPDVPNLGDMTKFHEWPNLDINLLVGGTPCQAFSVAGLRQGLSDPRGNLTLTFLGLADRYRPEWVVWENVPGVLSDRTNAFGQFLAGLGQLGYGWAYRMLDAQYFGVAQRRRRMFVVGCLGGWQRAAAVLFEPESLRGDSPPSREKGERITARAQVGAGSGGGNGADCIPIQEPGKRTGSSTNNRSYGIRLGESGDPMFTLQSGAVHGVASVAPCVKSNQGKNSDAAMEAASLIAQQTFECAGIGAYKSSSSTLLKSGSDLGPGCEAMVAHSLRATGFDASEDGTGRGTPLVPVPWPAAIAPTLNASFGDKQGLEDQHALNGCGLFVADSLRCRRPGEGGISGDDTHIVPVVSPALNTQNGSHHAPDTKAYVAAIAFNHNAQAAQLPTPTRDTSINDGLTCSQQAAVAFQSLTHKGLGENVGNARPPETNANKVLRLLLKETGEKETAKWLLGILNPLQQKKILRQDLHGPGIRREANEAGRRLDDGALSCEKSDTDVPVSEVRIKTGPRCSPQGRELPEQLTRELDSLMQELSHEGTQSERAMQDLRTAGERLGVLQPTLPSVQRGSAMSVRRLTPIECEKLQGFSVNYTAIPWRGKPAELCPDGPRYKALGNSMAVPCMAWIGRRIAHVHGLEDMDA